MFRRFPLPGMPTPLPRRNRWMLSLSRSSGDGLPLNSRQGRLPPHVLFEACSAFTHVSACLFARSPKVTFYTEYFNEFVTSFAALIASGRATDWPGGIRTHWKSPTSRHTRFSTRLTGDEFWDGSMRHGPIARSNAATTLSHPRRLDLIQVTPSLRTAGPAAGGCDGLGR